VAAASKRETKRRAKRLYHGAKISDYQFKKVLWHFVLDESAVEAAQHISLSANSIGAIYGKLRQFFFDYGLFRDPYNGGDPRGGLSTEGFEDIEFAILTYHLKRVSEKRGQLHAPLHLGESSWRFNFVTLFDGREPETVRHMMYAHLLEFIRRFGPVGSPAGPTNAHRVAGLNLVLEQLDGMALWMERYSAKFRDPAEKAKLKKFRDEE
jgi:hypothetical protein